MELLLVAVGMTPKSQSYNYPDELCVQWNIVKYFLGA